MSRHKNEPIALDDRDPWLVEQYGGRPITPRAVGEDEDFARISAQNFLFEPLVWFFAGIVLHGAAWRSVWDIAGYWMVLFVMLPLRLMDTDKPRDHAFRAQYVALQLLTLLAGYVGWRVAGGPNV
ncbi:MAG TPA: hypothetical protein VGM37_10800 [Armatimonadota bacterium]